MLGDAELELLRPGASSSTSRGARSIDAAALLDRLAARRRHRLPRRLRPGAGAARLAAPRPAERVPARRTSPASPRRAGGASSRSWSTSAYVTSRASSRCAELTPRSSRRPRAEESRTSRPRRSRRRSPSIVARREERTVRAHDLERLAEGAVTASRPGSPSPSRAAPARRRRAIRSSTAITSGHG